MIRRWQEAHPRLWGVGLYGLYGSLAALVICALLWLAFLWADTLYPLPRPEQQERRFAQLVVAQDGTPLRAFADPQGVWRYPIERSQVSPNYLQALLGYEDRWFYRHPGVNPAALARAIYQRLRYGRWISGGSTLTMQVARLLDPHPRTPLGKLQQIFRALQLERQFSKDQILTFYLNYAPFGGALEGVQAASYSYFGRGAEQLSDAEAALLAVLPQRPSDLRPDRYPERGQAARDKLIQRLVDQQIWSAERAAQAQLEAVRADLYPQPLHAPLLSRRLRQSYPDRALIATTLDLQLQTLFEGTLASYVPRLAAKTTAAALLVENQTLATRAYVGSARFADPNRLGHVDMVQAIRSPGSTLKPILYAMALDRGLIHSQSLLTDAPLDFNGYQPMNFDQRFRGPISAQDALQQSLNVPAVQLLDQLTPERFYARVQHVGVPLQLPLGARPNLSLALGGAGINMEGLAHLYTALGRQGLAGAPHYLQESDSGRRLVSEGAAWITQQMMQLPLGRTPLLYQQSRSYLPKIAFKTGTSFGFRDAWAVAVTARWTLVVWVGRPDGSALPWNSGRFSAVPLMEQLLNLLPVDDLAPPPMPDSVSSADICWPLGGLAVYTLSNLCHKKQRAWVLEGTAPATLPDPHIAAGESLLGWLPTDIAGEYRVPPGCQQAAQLTQIARWPPSLIPFLPERLYQSMELPVDPDCHDQVAQTSTALRQRLRLQGVADGDRLTPLPGQDYLPPLQLNLEGSEGDSHWFLNGEWLGVSDSAAWRLEHLEVGDYQLAVIDSLGRNLRLRFSVTQPGR